MDGQARSPQSTLVVLLGASEWPNWPDLNQELSGKDLGSADTFARSAEGVEKYFLDYGGFNLPEDNLLNLFNSKDEPGSQMRILAEFLQERIASLKDTENPATHLIVYYVGHGGLARGDFYLSIRNSEKDSKIATSLTPKSLAEVIKNNARQLRCFLIVDSCFAGATKSAFEETPINGVSLLCSSASDKISQATQGEPMTMFSRALLQVLKQGNREGPKWFSLRMLRKAVTQEIIREHGEKGVEPVIHSPVQSDGDIAELPLFPNAGCRPPKGREVFRQNGDIAQCYVIESATEEKVGKNELLGVTVGSALEQYKETLRSVIGKPLDTNPVVVNVDRIVASQDGFKNAVQALCQAEIAVFDVTNYEPAVMLLLGIRSVVRRGVTIASSGGEYVIGDPVTYPFSIKEVNIVSHSKEQIDLVDPIDLIGEKIIAGFEQLHNVANYLDLPVFDAIRSLPPEREQRIPKEHSEQVLVLCPFSQRYSDNNWKYHLSRYLRAYLPKSDDGTPPRIVRTLDLKSPRLVSQSLYEAIRLTLMCIVDWTEWRPNVFFELGVRLAAVNTNPVCIIEMTHKTLIKEMADIEDWNERFAKVGTWLEANKNAANDKASNTKEVIERLFYSTYQCRRLLEMFDPIDYKAPRQGRITDEDRKRYLDMVHYHEQLIKGDDRLGYGKTLPLGFTYGIVSDYIDVSMEVSAVPVHDELMRAAALLSDPQIDSTGRSPVLYPNNESLTGKANEGALERRLAAWYYIDSRLKDKLEEDPMLRKKYIDLGKLLARALLRSDKEMAKRIRLRIKELEGKRKQEDHP